MIVIMHGLLNERVAEDDASTPMTLNAHCLMKNSLAHYLLFRFSLLRELFYSVKVKANKTFMVCCVMPGPFSSSKFLKGVQKSQFNFLRPIKSEILLNKLAHLSVLERN